MTTAGHVELASLAAERDGDVDGAIAFYEQAIREAATFDDPEDEGLLNLRLALGALATRSNRFEVANEQLLRVVETAYFAASDPVGLKAAVLHDLGMSFRHLGDPHRSLPFLEEAARLLTAVPERCAAVLSDLATVTVHTGDLGRALSIYEHAIGLLDGPSRTAGALWSMYGAALCDAGRLGEAERALHRSLAAYDATGDLAGASGTHNNLGRMARVRGDLDAALTWYESARELARVTSHPTLSNILGNVAAIRHQRGDLEGAMIDLLEAVAMDRAAGAGLSLAQHLLGLARLHLARSDTDSGERFLMEALEIADAAAPRGAVAFQSLLALGSILASRGDLDGASEAEAEARTRLTDSSPPGWWADARTASAGLLRRRGRFDEAVEEAAAAHRIRAASAAEGNEALAAEHLLGLCKLDLGFPGDALRHAEHVRRVLEERAPLSDLVGWALALGATARRRLGDLDGAIDVLERAVDLAEQAREHVAQGDARELWFVDHLDAHDELLAALFDRAAPGDADRAFELAELVRARTVQDVFGGQAHLRDEPREVAELRRLAHAGDHELARLGRLLADAGDDTDDAARLSDEARLVRDELTHLRALLHQSAPPSATGRAPAQIDELAARLPPGTCAIAFASTTTATYAWMVGGGTRRAVRVEVPEATWREVVTAAVGGYHVGRLARDPEEPDAVASARRRLAADLLGPFADDLAAAERVLVVPSGPLHLVPFELLTPPGHDEPLGLTTPVAYAPSATVWLDVVRRPAPDDDRRGFVGIGAPRFAGNAAMSTNLAADKYRSRGLRLSPLPGADRELQAIAALFGPDARTYVGDDATELTIKTRAAGHRFVHLATHGLVDDRDPAWSGLAWAPPAKAELAVDPHLDDLLQVFEIEALEIDADLVVCSACSTGVGAIRRGEGVLGLTRAFLTAGTRCVVVSLWPVADDVTAAYMTTFYERLLGGDTVADALHAARVEVHFDHPDPGLWAAFVAVGDAL